MCNMLYMNLFLLSRIFNKKLIKGFPPCTECPDPNSDCNKPCGCGGGPGGGCGSGGGTGGGGGGSGPGPRDGFAAGPAPGSSEEIIDIIQDPNFTENVSNEIEEFLAVGGIPFNSDGIPVADTGGSCFTIPFSQMFGGGGCDGGCGPGCGGEGGGFVGGFNAGNPFIGYQNGNFYINASMFGQGNGNNMGGVTYTY